MKKYVVVSWAVCLSVIMIGAAIAGSHSPNGSAGQGPAFYDDVQHMINLKELSPEASGALIAHNKSINHIFVVEPSDENLLFIPVIDAIQGDGFNPLWQEVLITFLTIPPKQFTSDTDVLAARDAGQISLTDTDEVYRCSVVGPKK